jgi:predicted nuclease of predicted toxin-antitoxin system
VKFLIDESTDARLVDYFISAGHDAAFIAHSHGSGLPDQDVLAIAYSEGRVLVTDDRDFGDLVFRQQKSHVGVLYFRLSTSVLADRIARLDAVIREHGDELGQFIVVEDHRTRIRTR